MTDHQQIAITINLAGLSDRIQRHLRASMSIVAIGLNAAKSITVDALALPDITTHHQFDSSNPWTIDQASAAWQTWVLRNGFRDVAEAVSGLLEEVQSVLSHWHLVSVQHDRSLRGEDWNELVVNRGLKFHRLGLPDKIDFLNKEYGLALDDSLVGQVLSINAARNCLVHRGGLVSTLDARNGNHLQIEWRALVILITEDGVEKEIEPPYLVKAGGQLGIATRHRTKLISVGQPIQVTAQEFTQMCWTLFLFSIACAQTLEAYGKARGIQFQSKPNAS